jgi:hypothetical protein
VPERRGAAGWQLYGSITDGGEQNTHAAKNTDAAAEENSDAATAAQDRKADDADVEIAFGVTIQARAVSEAPNVRFGSLAAAARSDKDVRSTPQSHLHDEA